MENNHIKIAIAENHKMVRKGFVNLINGFSNFEVVIEADNGKELIDKLVSVDESLFPKIVILDIEMPIMDGFKTAEIVRNIYSNTKILCMSYSKHLKRVIRAIDSGAHGYIWKEEDPKELHAGLLDLCVRQSYTSRLIQDALFAEREEGKKAYLSTNKMKFIKLVCSELTYKEIADRMYLAKSTVDGYRECLFPYFKVRSRTGLVVHVLKNGIVNLDDLKAEFPDLF